jgi:hypothetical protein
MLHDIILAYARRTALTTNDMSFKDRLLRIRTEGHDTTSAVKDNLERCEHLRGKVLGILNWEISVTPAEHKSCVLGPQSTKRSFRRPIRTVSSELVQSQRVSNTWGTGLPTRTVSYPYYFHGNPGRFRNSLIKPRDIRSIKEIHFKNQIFHRGAHAHTDANDLRLLRQSLLQMRVHHILINTQRIAK